MRNFQDFHGLDDLDERLQRLAAEGATLARSRGLDAAVRRGRRRRRNVAGAAALMVVAAVLAGALGPRSLLGSGTVRPAPSAGRLPAPTKQPGLEILKVTHPAADAIVVQGTVDGRSWRFTASGWTNGKEGLPDKIDGSDAGVVTGELTTRVAMVQVYFQRAGRQLPPVNVPAIRGGPRLPVNFFFIKQPGPGITLSRLVLLDRGGTTLCGFQGRVSLVLYSAAPVSGSAFSPPVAVRLDVPFDPSVGNSCANVADLIIALRPSVQQLPRPCIPVIVPPASTRYGLVFQAANRHFYFGGACLRVPAALNGIGSLGASFARLHGRDVAVQVWGAVTAKAALVRVELDGRPPLSVHPAAAFGLKVFEVDIPPADGPQVRAVALYDDHNRLIERKPVPS